MALTRGRWPSGRPGGLVLLLGLVAWIATSSSLLAAVAAAPRPEPQRTAPAAQSGKIDARIGGSAPGSWDPAQAGDVDSAAVLGQVFEGLTAFDSNSNVQPGLAESWSVEQSGRRIVFKLRTGLKFSDGSPLTAQDVVFSWLRLLEPQHRSPLASLLDDVAGAIDYGHGNASAERVGIRADGNQVVVELRRPAAYFLSVTASPALAVVSHSSPPPDSEELPKDLVVSGAYRPVEQSATSVRLEANPNYWAGLPPLKTILLVGGVPGKSTVEAFDDGDLDYTGVATFDAAWIRYDRDLGPQLREIPSFSVFYYGFDTTRPPFNDKRVRQAFAQAVDWHRLARLAAPDSVPATSLVPQGIPGRSDEDFTPVHDPSAARAALAAAGFPAGRGFPPVTLLSGGSSFDAGVVKGLKDVLGVGIGLEVMSFNAYFDRLEKDPPLFWSLSWIADYPHPQDFLGLLAQTGSGNNYGRWSNAAYDSALEAAAATSDVAQQQRHYDDAQRILRDEAPLVAVTYSQGWALSKQGLLGAAQSGVGFLRLASLKWANR